MTCVFRQASGLFQLYITRSRSCFLSWKNTAHINFSFQDFLLQNRNYFLYTRSKLNFWLSSKVKMIFFFVIFSLITLFLLSKNELNYLLLMLIPKIVLFSSSFQRLHCKWISRWHSGNLVNQWRFWRMHSAKTTFWTNRSR